MLTVAASRAFDSQLRSEYRRRAWKVLPELASDAEELALPRASAVDCPLLLRVSLFFGPLSLFREPPPLCSSESLLDEPDLSVEGMPPCPLEAECRPLFMVVLMSSALCFRARNPSKKPLQAPLVYVSFDVVEVCASAPVVTAFCTA